MAGHKRDSVQPLPGHWLLQDAKARFSELVRRAHAEGPQHVTVHGRDEVVILSAAEFQRLKGGATGQRLIEIMREAADPELEFDVEPVRDPAPLRDVVF